MRALVILFWTLASSAFAIGAERPNILFIMTDQQFGDAMSCRMGTDYIHTPAMDSLAENGAVFARAYAPNPLCMPARNSIFTGRYPHETGVTKNARSNFNVSEFVSMGTYFRQAGYETAYFGKWHLAFDQSDVTQHGFETTARLKRERMWDPKISAAAVKFISRKHDQPFLAVVSLHNPHDICEYARGQDLPGGNVSKTPPPDQWPPVPANLSPPVNETDSMTLLRKGYHANRMFPVGKFTVARWRIHRWGYYRLIEKVDAEIGKVLSALRKAGLEEDTLIIFTSDHGECAGAHNFNQKTVFYDESARIPLVVSFKGRIGKAVSDTLINTGVDILPTMLDFAGIPAPKKLPGRSLRPDVMGQPPRGVRDYLVIQNNLSQTSPVGDIRPQSEGRMVRTDRYKYCVYEYGEQRESLVDMLNDPLERKNLAGNPDFRQIVLEHRQHLLEFARLHSDELAVNILENDVEPRPFPVLREKKPKL